MRALEFTNIWRRDVNKPDWDDTILTRLRYYIAVTNPLTILASKQKLLAAKDLVEQHKRGDDLSSVTEEDLRAAHSLYESTYHPVTGEKRSVLSRMAFQVPGGMVMTGLLLHFYKTNTAVCLCQILNQSYYAYVNYANRVGVKSLEKDKLAKTYFYATAAGVVTALFVKMRMNRWQQSRVYQRTVPFFGVAAATVVNVSLMRHKDIVERIPVYNHNGVQETVSRYASLKGVLQTCISRIVMVAPAMLIIPQVMERYDAKIWMRRIHHLPLQMMMAGAFLVVMVPVSCALFPQRSVMTWDRLYFFDRYQNEDYKREFGLFHPPYHVYFNKGL